MSTALRSDSQRTGVLWWATHVISWVVIGAVVAAIVVSVLVPRIAGATPYTILTGSMRPTMPPGTLVVMKPAKPEDIGIGTVITYQLSSGKPTVVTHRVVSTVLGGDGEMRFRTRGDANEATDLKAVHPVQIKGALWYEVPYLGYVNKYITGKERHFTMIIVVSGLLLYAAFMFTSALRDRPRKPAQRSMVESS